MTANRRFESVKDTGEIGTGEWSDSRLEVDSLTHLDPPANENTSVFVVRTTVMSRGRGQDVIDPYRTCKDFLNQQAHRRMEISKDDS